ncbi:type I polyketide synthase [Lipingzhangella sp. LS1_29]|uniref:Type I polyketide synthase n=2 Tax=Lipingzhangella rawalii TaxID=2055835 RepID=A0ABU2H149_9ACTN|nr:type I polyketide synthase [Lipingzhangella rawalii]MDS1269021.1 type I polyketide synthase [Lipingzhangella rawalii]
MIEAIRHAHLPCTLHVDEPTPHLDWSRSGLALLTRARDWPDMGRPRRAAVSAFGVSGTNAHLVLEQAPTPEASQDPRPDSVQGGETQSCSAIRTETAIEAEMVVGKGRTLPWLLSARSSAALRRQARQLADRIEAEPEVDPVGIAWSLATQRTQFPYRAAIVDRDLAGFHSQLTSLAENRPASGLVNGQANASRAAVFVFGGQGAQWVGMGAGLLDSSEVFAEWIAACEKALAPWVDWSVRAVLRGENHDSDLRRVDVVQPVLWAVMVSLAEVWRSSGVEPAMVVGHSQGEIAAATVAGALSLEDAALVVARRSQAIAANAPPGAMAALATNADQVRPLIDPESEVELAAVNGPNATVVAGRLAAVEAVVDQCARLDVRASILPVDYASHTAAMEPLRPHIRNDLAGITPQPPRVPMYSTLTADWVVPTTPLNADYWYRNLRYPVQFHSATKALLAHQPSVFLDVSPHPSLGPTLIDTLAEAPSPNSVVLHTLHRDAGDEATQLAIALARAHVHGLTVDWPQLLPPPSTSPPELPTYPFEHQHFWLSATPDGIVPTSNDPEALDHPLLDTAVSLADRDGYVISGHINLDTHPWLGDHTALGQTLLPGTAFVDLALYVGQRIGLGTVAELVIHTPLPLAEGQTKRLQVTVDAPDPQGRRELRVSSAVAEADPIEQHAWVQHVTATLAPDAVARPQHTTTVPHPEATPLSVTELYTRLDELGYGYGPAFQGVTRAWQQERDLYAEVDLGEEQRSEAENYCLHPALLDAAQHVLASLTPVTRQSHEERDDTRLPFSWNGIRLYTTGATQVRVHVRPGGEGQARLELSDPTGTPVASIESLQLRPAQRDQLTRANADRLELYRLEWPVLEYAPQATATHWTVLGPDHLGIAEALTRQGHSVQTHATLDEIAERMDAATADGHRAAAPHAMLVPVAVDAGTTVTATHTVTQEVLSLLQRWFSDSRFDEVPVVVLTRRAVSVVDGEPVADLSAAAVWGLVRSIQREYPQRCVLMDLEDAPSAVRQLSTTLLDLDEPQLAVRAGQLYAPRLARIQTTNDTEPVTLPRTGTVLVTGAGGTLGQSITHHLASRYEVSHLLLLSRTGSLDPHVEAELVANGTSVESVACDVADREALRAVLDAIPTHRPLSAVIHIAGTLDDATVGALTPPQIETVLRPKVDAAIHLHELTQGHDLEAFVLFSSAAGTFGGAGQANYAAANSFLDALATYRRKQGLPATSLAWGLWERRSQLTAKVNNTDLRRYARLGMAGPVSTEGGLALFDAALAADEPHILPVPLDTAAVRARARRSGKVDPLFRGLIAAPRPLAAGEARTEDPNSLVDLPLEKRYSVLLELVRARTAEILGHSQPSDITTEDAFLELGFDSLTAVELRNHLAMATGLHLPAGLVFQYTTPAAVAQHLQDQLSRLSTGQEDSTEDGIGDGASGDVGEALVTLFEQCCHQGKIAEGFQLVEAAAQVRASFAVPVELAEPRDPVRLSQQAASYPVLVCLPSLLMISGVQEYARFSAGVTGLREVEVLPHPGFGAAEPLPNNVEVVARLHADTIAHSVGDRPFVVVGRSSGGWLAQEVTQHLEHRRLFPQALALLDAPAPTDRTLNATVETGVVQRAELLGIMDSVRLTAMGAYLRLFRDWQPQPITTPTVILRPQEPTIDRDGQALAPFTWDLPHTVLEVPGDHFSMLEGDVDVVARHLHDWLAERGW